MFKPITFIAIIGITILLGCVQPPASQVTNSGACPDDILVCPNGTMFHRSGPNCEFPNCSNSNGTAAPPSTAPTNPNSDPTNPATSNPTPSDNPPASAPTNSPPPTTASPAPPGNDPCASLPPPSNTDGTRNNCYTNVADYMSDASLCEKITVDFFKSICITKVQDNAKLKVAVDAGDSEQCSSLSAFKKDICYKRIAVQSNNPSLCNNLVFGPEKPRCFTSVAVKAMDQSICNQITQENSKNSCIQTVQFYSQNNTCQTDPNKDSCLTSYEQSIDDNPSICGQIGNETIHISYYLLHDLVTPPQPYVQLGTRKDYCYLLANSSHFTKMYCNQMSSDEMKTFCNIPDLIYISTAD